MTLDTSLEKVKVYASWFEYNKPIYKTLSEAYDEVESGRAVIITEDTIYLKVKKKKFRTRILERDNYICYFCGEPGDTLEHLQPVSKGGKNTEDNCVCACARCNNEKGDMSERQYNKYLYDLYKKYKKRVN